MDYLRILSGKEKPLPIYTGVIACLENPLAFPGSDRTDLP